MEDKVISSKVTERNFEVLAALNADGVCANGKNARRRFTNLHDY
jgi:hypothetical protein